MDRVDKEKKYSSQHEWVAISGESATVGVTDYVQSMVGDVIFVGLPHVGQEVRRGECVAVLESAKTATDVFSPMSGLVREVNRAVLDDPDLINREPYGDGWLFKILMTNPSEKYDLLDYEAYLAARDKTDG